jgi:hypothetical protein
MINTRNIFLLAILIGLVLFCGSRGLKKTADRDTLLKYLALEAHGTTCSQTSAEVNYKLTYKPNSLVVQQWLRGGHRNADSLFRSLNDCLYFTLQLSRGGSELFGRISADFDALLKKTAFGLGEEIVLKDDTSGELFYLADFACPRMYGSTPATSILLCFKDPQLNRLQHFTIRIRDFVNANPEHLSFHFSKKNLDKVPALKLKGV